MKRQGAMVNHVGTFREQMLKLFLNNRKREFTYHQVALALGIPYFNFNRRAARETRALFGYITLRREGRRVFLKVSESMTGSRTADILRDFRTMQSA